MLESSVSGTQNVIKKLYIISKGRKKAQISNISLLRPRFLMGNSRILKECLSTFSGSAGLLSNTGKLLMWDVSLDLPGRTLKKRWA